MYLLKDKNGDQVIVGDYTVEMDSHAGNCVGFNNLIEVISHDVKNREQKSDINKYFEPRLGSANYFYFGKLENTEIIEIDSIKTAKLLYEK